MKHSSFIWEIGIPRYNMDFLSSGLSITRGYMTRIFITLLTVMLMSDHPQIAQFKKQGSLWDARMHEFDIIISYPYELGFIINYEDMYYTWANFSLISKVLYVASIWKLAWTTKLHWKWMIHIGANMATYFLKLVCPNKNVHKHLYYEFS